MKIKRTDDRPVVIHTRAKTKIHAHMPKKATIKGGNIYTAERAPKIKNASFRGIRENPGAGSDRYRRIKNVAGNMGHYRKSTFHQADLSKERGLNRFKKSVGEANSSVKVKKRNLHIAGAVGAEGVKAISDQLEGGQEIQQAAVMAYDFSRPAAGMASKGAALFRRREMEKKKRKIKKIEAGKRIGRKATGKAAKDTVKRAAGEAAKETAKTTAKVSAKTAAAAGAAAAGGAAGPIGAAAGYAAGQAAGAKIEHDDRVMTNRIRKIRFFMDKMKEEDKQRDNLVKLAKDLVTRRISEWVRVHAGTLGIIFGGCLLLVSVTVIPVISTVGILYNSPFSIFLPSLGEGDTVMFVTEELLSAFRAEVYSLASVHEGYDEGEVVYVDYEGTEAMPGNYYDIMAVYMVRYGIGDTAVIMNDTSRAWLKSVADDMCSYSTAAGTREVDDGQGGTKTVSVLSVNVSLKTYRDMIAVYGFGEEEVFMLQEIMRPENLKMLGYTGGYDGGSPGICELSEEEIEAILSGIADGKQRAVCSYALHRVGFPYSQDLRDTGNYYDCSSLAFYSWKSAGTDISHGGSTTAAAEAQGLDEAGRTVSFSEMQPGDLIFYSYARNGRYKNISHVAVYVGNGKLVEAQNEQNGVVFRDASESGSIVLIGRP